MQRSRARLARVASAAAEQVGGNGATSRARRRPDRRAAHAVQPGRCPLMQVRLAALLALLALGAEAVDPTCSKGILSGSACCPKECGRCGGPSCGTLPGGSANCCTGSIVGHKDSCDNYDPPCVFHKAKPATDCGDYPATLATDRPNVLLIGDSISMPVPYTPGGYGDNARQLLTNLGMRVWHNGGWGSGGQASNTVKGLHCTNASTPGNWLNVSGTYDVIHFNFGLHECVSTVCWPLGSVGPASC